MKYAIKHRWTGKIIFEAEIEHSKDEPEGVKLGLAVKAAVKARANLAYADLTGANLADAYLADAYLAGAKLTGAKLTGANLADAYLADANLADANLAYANLADAYLADANLAGAKLTGAKLTGANLADAYLADANLTGANLADAYLAGGIKAYGYVFTKPPIQISDKYHVNIWQGFMTIGCEAHTLKQWPGFTQKQIIEMGGKEALEWWKKWKKPLLAIAEANDRMELPEQKEQEAK